MKLSSKNFFFFKNPNFSDFAVTLTIYTYYMRYAVCVFFNRCKVVDHLKVLIYTNMYAKLIYYKSSWNKSNIKEKNAAITFF